jgi:hypothetical protein
MQLDIAVESVLTASGAMHAAAAPAVGAPRRWSATARRALRGDRERACWTVETDERLAAFCEGPAQLLRGRGLRHDIPGAVLLALGTEARRALEIAGEAAARFTSPWTTARIRRSWWETPAADRQSARSRGSRGHRVPRSCPTTAPCTRRCSRPSPRTCAHLRGSSGGSGGHRLWSCTTAAPYPDDPAPSGAAGRALDQPGSLP